LFLVEALTRSFIGIIIQHPLEREHVDGKEGPGE
jgi:hypothetical protein